VPVEKHNTMVLRIYFFNYERVSELIKYQGTLNTWSVLPLNFSPLDYQYVIIHVKMP